MQSSSVEREKRREERGICGFSETREGGEEEGKVFRKKVWTVEILGGGMMDGGD